MNMGITGEWELHDLRIAPALQEVSMMIEALFNQGEVSPASLPVGVAA